MVPASLPCVKVLPPGAREWVPREAGAGAGGERMRGRRRRGWRAALRHEQPLGHQLQGAYSLVNARHRVTNRDPGRRRRHRPSRAGSGDRIPSPMRCGGSSSEESVDLAFRPSDVRRVLGVRFSGSARHACIDVGIGRRRAIRRGRRADAVGPGRAGRRGRRTGAEDAEPTPRDRAVAPSGRAGGAERRTLRPPAMALLRARAQAIGQEAQAEAGGADAPRARGWRVRRGIGTRRRCRSDSDW